MTDGQIIYKICLKLWEWRTFCSVSETIVVLHLSKLAVRITKQATCYHVGVRLTPARIVNGRLQKDYIFNAYTKDLGDEQAVAENNIRLLFQEAQTVPDPKQAFQNLFELEI